MPPDEHDAFRCLPMNTSIPLPPHGHDDDTVSPFRRSHVHEPWPYVRSSRRSRARPYVRTWPYLLSCTLAVRKCTCYVRASTMTRALPYSTTVHRCSLQIDRSTSMYVHVRDQNVNATYASTRWVPTVRHFLACEDVAGGSQQSGGWWVPAVRGRIILVFFPGRTSLHAKM